MCYGYSLRNQWVVSISSFLQARPPSPLPGFLVVKNGYGVTTAVSLPKEQFMLVIWHRRKGLETTRLTLSMIRKVQTSTLFSGYTVAQLIISPMV